MNDWRSSREAGFFKKVQMIFQNPYLSLDPRWKIRDIVGEGIGCLPATERRERIEAIFDHVHLNQDYLERYPGELSGGQRQRVAIARALVLEPEFLILDEPTSQLDVTVQAQILGLLKELRSSIHGGLLLITHDLAVANALSDEIVVMSGGRIVETGKTAEVLRSPQSPETRRLLDALPRWGGTN